MKFLDIFLLKFGSRPLFIFQKLCVEGPHGGGGQKEFHEEQDSDGQDIPTIIFNFDSESLSDLILENTVEKFTEAVYHQVYLKRKFKGVLGEMVIQIRQTKSQDIPGVVPQPLI